MVCYPLTKFFTKITRSFSKGPPSTLSPPPDRLWSGFPDSPSDRRRGSGSSEGLRLCPEGGPPGQVGRDGRLEDKSEALGSVYEGDDPSEDGLTQRDFRLGSGLRVVNRIEGVESLSRSLLTHHSLIPLKGS